MNVNKEPQALLPDSQGSPCDAQPVHSTCVSVPPASGNNPGSGFKIYIVRGDGANASSAVVDGGSGPSTASPLDGVEEVALNEGTGTDQGDVELTAEDIVHLLRVCREAKGRGVLNALTGVPKKRKIPRPPNSFMTYRQEKQAIVSANTKANNKEVSRIIGMMWMNETEETKDIYRKKAQQAKLEHQQKYPNYKYTPRKSSKGRAKGQKGLVKAGANKNHSTNANSTNSKNPSTSSSVTSTADSSLTSWPATESFTAGDTSDPRTASCPGYKPPNHPPEAQGNPTVAGDSTCVSDNVFNPSTESTSVPTTLGDWANYGFLSNHCASNTNLRFPFDHPGPLSVYDYPMPAEF